MPTEPELFVRSLERGLRVLRCFDGTPADLGLSEVAERSGMPAAAARRYLHTLAELGYLGCRDRRYFPLPRLLELAYPYFAASGVTRSVEAEIGTLATGLRASCALTVLDGHDVMNVFCVNEPEGLSIQLRVGRRLPTYCTAMGRALLSGHTDDQLRGHFADSELIAHTEHTVHEIADLLEVMRGIREDGYAVGNQEYEIGVRTIAMPVHDHAGAVAFAVSVSTPTAAVPEQRLRTEIRDRLAASVARIEAHLRLVPPWAGGR